MAAVPEFLRMASCLSNKQESTLTLIQLLCSRGAAVGADGDVGAQWQGSCGDADLQAVGEFPEWSKFIEGVLVHNNCHGTVGWHRFQFLTKCRTWFHGIRNGFGHE